MVDKKNERNLSLQYVAAKAQGEQLEGWVSCSGTHFNTGQMAVWVRSANPAVTAVVRTWLALRVNGTEEELWHCGASWYG